MKRQANLFEKICSMENLMLAHQNAKKGKGWYKEVQMIDENPEPYLEEIRDMLLNHTYHTSKYVKFTRREHGKERVIYKLPYFPDRIAQWAIVQVIEPYILKNFTADTYSAIPKRGIHYGMKRVRSDMDNDREGCKYCLKFDVKHYYQSVNHDILKQKFRRIFKDGELLWLLDEIIDSICTAEYDDLLNFYQEDDLIDFNTGIPIGNYISQYSGNFYLSSFDHWIKEVKHIKHYHRYMDDIVIFSDSIEELHQLIKDIEEYMRTELKLTIKGNWQVFPTESRGVDFLGYRFFFGYTLLRKSTAIQMKRKLRGIYKKVSSGQLMNYSEWCTINSYKGWLKHCDSFRLMNKYLVPLLPYAQKYYDTVIKGKGGKHGKSGKSAQHCKAA